jgi:chromosome segregation ATPase
VEQQINEVMSRLAECEAQYKGSREVVNRRKDNYGQKIKEVKNLQSRICRMESNINTLLQEIDKIKNK